MLTRARPAACIVIVDPARNPALPHNVLRRLYGLTPAEIRLTDQVASGKDLQSAAEELGISYKTARTQLAAIFRKTSTSRQGELVKLLLSELPAI
jgi:DNA-binding CsgD family transcriptional regulator